jgi:hypothetical protein
MAEHLIGRELCAAVLLELLEGSLSGSSAASRWLADVSQPPAGVSFDGPSTFSGLVVVVRNEVRRAWLLDHQTLPPWKPRHRPPPEEAYFD